MLASLAANLVNVALDYALIFGHWGFPAWGIAGAAVATVISSLLGLAMLLAIYFRRRFREEFATWSGRRPDRKLMAPLLRYKEESLRER